MLDHNIKDKETTIMVNLVIFRKNVYKIINKMKLVLAM
jgi:hypothetical protein